VPATLSGIYLLQEQLISRRTIDTITCVYAPLGVIILAYALWTYEIRSTFMRKKQVCDA